MDCPYSARLAYTAAVHQLHLVASDVEAALQYIEIFLAAFVDIDGNWLNVPVASRVQRLSEAVRWSTLWLGRFVSSEEKGKSALVVDLVWVDVLRKF